MERIEPQHISGIALLEAVTAVLGVWLIASTYALRLAPWESVRQTNGIIGSVFFGMALTRLAMSGPRWWWLHIVTLVAALWLIASPFVLGYAGNATATINAIVVGALVALVEVVGMLTGRRETAPARRA